MDGGSVPGPSGGGAGGTSSGGSSSTGWSLYESLALAGGIAAAALGYVWWSRSRAKETPPVPTSKTSARTCNSCGRPGSAQKPLVRCSRCRSVWYCSRECQRNDWTRHKSQCAAAAGSSHDTAEKELPAWASGMTRAQYQQVEALLKQNDEQFERYLMQAGPKPDSVDDVWENFSSDEKRQLIEDTLWYKEFYLRKFESISDSYQIPAFIRRLDAIDFFSKSPTLISFFSAVFNQQSEDTLSAWAEHFAQDLAESDSFRSSFLTFLRFANTQHAQECGQKIVASLPEEKKQAATGILSLEVPKPIAEPLSQPIVTPQAIDHMWAVFFATGNEAIIDRFIQQAMSLGIQARAMAAFQQAEAQLLMQTCNYAIVTLINEGTNGMAIPLLRTSLTCVRAIGIFDSKVRLVCERELKELVESGKQTEVMHMLQEVIAQQQANIQQLGDIPAEEVQRMRVEVDGHRPFIERMHSLKHREKVERLKQSPGVRVVPSRFGPALWIPSSPAAAGPGRLFMTMEE